MDRHHSPSPKRAPSTVTSTIERIFVDWDHPALPAAASLLAQTYASDRSIPMSDVAVAVPGGRAGRRLSELLLDEAMRRGLPLAPPRVVTIGALPELLIEPARPPADPILALVVLARALREEDPAGLAEVFPATPLLEDFAGWTSLAANVMRLHREVSGGGHQFADVARLCSSGDLLHDDQGRWATLAAVQARYQALLGGLDRSDPDLARLDPESRPRGDAPGDIWLLGVVEVPRVTRGILERFSGRIRAVVHAPESEASSFDPFGAVLPPAWANREIPIDDEVLRIADRPGNQSWEVVEQLVMLDGAYAPEEITVGVPDADLVPYLERRLEEAGAPARYAGGVPLPRTAPYRLLEAAADYLRDGSWDAFATLRRHPDVPGSGYAADLGRLDKFHADHLTGHVSRGLPGNPSEQNPLAEALSTLERRDLVGRLRGRKRLSEWQEEILGFLAECHGGRALDRDNPGDRRLLAALEAIRAVAAAFHNLPFPFDEQCGSSSAIRLLLDAARGQAIPEEPDSAAVELLGWLEMHLDDTPVALIAGLNEPFLPESVSADAFLPDRFRSVLGLADNAARYARDAYQLTALLNSRERVCLIAGRLNATGDPLRPSRLMLACGGERLARRVHWFAGGGEAAEAREPAGIECEETAPPRRSSFRLPPELEIRLDPPAAMSVTDFRAVLNDPYLYALERHLRLRALDDSARELDGLAFGSLAHRVLQSFGHSAEARSSDLEEVTGRLDLLLDGEAARSFGDVAVPAVAIQIEQLRARLHAFGDWQTAHVRAGWEVVVVEGSPAGEPPADGRGATLIAELDVDGEPMPIRGRIDRIDRHSGTGEWLILDYKTSDGGDSPEKTHRSGRGDARGWCDLQLPLYRHLAATLRDPRGFALIPTAAGSDVKVGYILLPRELGKTGGSIAEWSEADLEDADRCAERVVRVVRRGVYTFDPELASRYRAGPLAPLLGLRQLVAAEDEDEESEVVR
jgi:ATP-dependent helicase/nuclease subunit B